MTNVFYKKGHFLGAIDTTFALVGLLGLTLTRIALIGNITRVQRRLIFVEVDTLLILIGYVLEMWFL